MSEFILITGGARSGKSTYARLRGEALPGPRTYVATCPVAFDAEMDARIASHKKDRDPKIWQTIEELKELPAVISQLHIQKVILVDCLTLWLYNFMREAKAGKLTFDEDMAKACCLELAEAARNFPGTILVITNELGSGIVPIVPAGRMYRDMVGRCNQILASAANEVVLTVCGQALKIKG
ncbi:MAG: hypothetical protein A2901_09715 [Elusimicrobia bacterium RIFCSPLOWO2_01_FULL_54_10]|nr:MAG: hypothetical protein A2901_09715 [Elusimicrobia bacterium RIFCSPLOWO2_01_FULL_54_10]